MNEQDWKSAIGADFEQRAAYIADLLANRVPDGGLQGEDKLLRESSVSARRWSEDDVARFATTIYDWPEDAIDKGLYWDDAMQATAMLMASLYVLARELSDHHDHCGTDWPVLVKHVVTTTIAKAPLLRAKVVEALF